MKKILLSLAVFIALFGILVAPAVINAADPEFQLNNLGSFAASTSLATADIRATAARIINSAMALLGVVAVVIILIGGFKWMTAMGNDEAVKKAKTLIIQGVIGLVIIVCAYAIAQFVLNALYSATT